MYWVISAIVLLMVLGIFSEASVDEYKLHIVKQKKYLDRVL
jgi:hypothetical protein